MGMTYPGGYMGKILRVDLTNQRTSVEVAEELTLRNYLGGVGLGTKILYEKTVPGVEWNDPRNPLIWASGPLAGTRMAGSGTLCVVTRGPMTNLAASSQANGFFGAFLKFSGFDAIVIEGVAEKWSYLFVHDGIAELRDATPLLGKDTWEIEDMLREELKEKRLSVYGIGPAGENRVRFAAIAGDKGHVIAHNGTGAVMGSKKLKAIAVVRGNQTVPVKDPERLNPIAKELFEISKARTVLGRLPIGGTSANVEEAYRKGGLPVKNYTTNIFPEYKDYIGMAIRARFEVKPKPCWACGMNHCEFIKVTDGSYAGYEGEEPEYEQFAAFGCVIGQTDPGAAVMLSNLGDRLGLDANECGWVIAWTMECYEKGLLTIKDLDGLEMTWGNAAAAAAMLRKIADREGFGNLLAEGVKRAAEEIGGEALNCAIYTKKGAAPRSHDHRSFWHEMFDTCVSNTGTIESWGGRPQPLQLGLSPVKDSQNPWEVSTLLAWLNGRRQFEDCLGVCRFCAEDFQLTLDGLNAVTGWKFDKKEAMDVGARVVNQLRVFNFRHGLTRDMEAPSSRYGSTPTDGPLKGISIMPHWDFMLRNYYRLMGWDTDSGKPLPETLRALGLDHLIRDL
jgi:aldehyde:ferredoxin oxidoreductase